VEKPVAATATETRAVAGEIARSRTPAYAAPRLDAVTLDRGPHGSTDLGGVAVGRWGDVPLDVRTSWVTRPLGLQLTITGAHATAVIRAHEVLERAVAIG
jgi:hypothetical protein